MPRVAVDGGSPTPGRASTYGHGLFGSASEVFNSDIQQELANTHGFTFCATDEIGMSNSDVSNTAAAVLPDLSNFPMLADRLHQGLLNGLFLGRLMIHPGRLREPRRLPRRRRHAGQPAGDRRRPSSTTRAPARAASSAAR